MAKKFLFILILLLCTISKASCASVQSGFLKYQETPVGKADCLIVLPIDSGFFNSSVSSYSSTINMISNDIVNTANNTEQLHAMPLEELNYRAKRNKLEPDIKKIIYTYKAKSIIDYRSLNMICNVLNADKVLFVAGDFNPMRFFIEPHSAKSLDITPSAMICPTYSINMFVMLIDPGRQSVLWEKTYCKKFVVETPQTDFEHNTVTIRNLRAFSGKISQHVVNNLNALLYEPEPIKSVTSTIVNTSNQKNKSTDGITTKDGHSFTTVNKFVKSQKQKYSGWAVENL